MSVNLWQVSLSGYAVLWNMESCAELENLPHHMCFFYNTSNWKRSYDSDEPWKCYFTATPQICCILMLVWHSKHIRHGWVLQVPEVMSAFWSVVMWDFVRSPTLSSFLPCQSLLCHAKDTMILTPGPDWLWPGGQQSAGGKTHMEMTHTEQSTMKSHHHGKPPNFTTYTHFEKMHMRFWAAFMRDIPRILSLDHSLSLRMCVCIWKRETGHTVVYSQVSTAINVFIVLSHTHTGMKTCFWWQSNCHGKSLTKCFQRQPVKQSWISGVTHLD